MAKPPLGLHAEVEDATGSLSRWDYNAEAKNRPRDISFSTKLGEGFDQGSCSLARRYDRDFDDLNLLDTLSLVGDDGFVAYEGQINALPRSLGESHQIDVNAEGWMNHARRRTFVYPYVDRGLDQWGSASRTRRAALFAVNEPPTGSAESTSDVSGAIPALRLALDGNWVAPYIPCAESWYDAGSDGAVGLVYYDFVGDPTTVNTNFILDVRQADNDAAGGEVVSGDLFGALTGSGYYAFTTAKRYVYWNWRYNTTPAGTAGVQSPVDIRRLTAYGAHGLTRHPVATGEPDGLYASDVIKHIAANWAPKLDTSGVTDTTYPISHAAWHDEITPSDAWLELNKYHGWKIAVWEDRVLTFEPFDFSEPDWEVRASDKGVAISLQGDSISDTANGIVVHFTDFAGVSQRLTPDDDATLANTDESLPANAHGEIIWTTLEITSPCTAGDAAQIGRAALAEFNRAKQPGSITVKGHIRDGTGHWYQGWRVRAGDTVAVADHPNADPRLITETSWNDNDKELTITLDNAVPRLEIALNRQSNALQAAGLSS